MKGLLLVAGTIAVVGLSGIRGGAPDQQASASRPAVPVEPKSAILDAFKTHRIVGLGDAHGNLPGAAFQLDLIRDPRFAAVVNDVILESGNSKYQAVIDRFVGGADVPQAQLQRAWLDTTQQQVASLEIPVLITTVRALNASLPPGRRLRVLIAEPPIDWDSLRTAEDFTKWEADPMSSRDRFAADLIRREVLSKDRRALALFGAGHFMRKVVRWSLVTLLEEANGPRVFNIWTNAAGDMAAMQSDVARWPVPSLALVRGTRLGATPFADYFGPDGKDIPAEWRAAMQDQFDAVLYLGPPAAITLARPRPWRCSEPALPERLRRLALFRQALADRVQKECAPD
jgi:hypothetical protein